MRTIGYTNLAELYQSDEYLIYKLTPNRKVRCKIEGFDFYISTNSRGFRGEEILLKNNKEYKIFCIGDSTTFGWGVEFECVWTEKLERLLNAKFPEKKFKIINYGVPGYTSFQGVRLLKEALIYTPDAIIFSFGRNDGDKVRMTEREKCKNITKVRLYLQNMPLKSKIYVFLGFNFYMIGKLINDLLLRSSFVSLKMFKHEDYSKSIFHRVPINEYICNLRETIKICNNHNIKLIFLNMGWNTDMFPNDEEHDILYLNTTSALGEYYGIPVVEFERGNINPELFTHDNVHPSILGHGVLAKKVSEVLIRKNIF